MNLLAMGWGRPKAAERAMRYARPLNDQGVHWRSDDGPYLDTVTRLVREHVLGAEEWTRDPKAGALVALDAGAELIGAAVLNTWSFDGCVITYIQHLVVEPSWRGVGVGVVTLGTVPQVFKGRADPKPSYSAGCCAPGDARFYQRAGFTVLQPREPLVIPGGKVPPSIVDNEHYPCWFYRNW